MTAANAAEEQRALEQRYGDAIAIAEKTVGARKLDQFKKAVENSYAVISRSMGELQRLISSDNEVYATYYQLLQAGLRLPAGSKWDVLRAVADEALFPGYKDRIRFGALSLNNYGLANYGECHMRLRDEMIAHRTTVFEENSTIWMKHQGVKMSEANELPTGFRATWDKRAIVALAKLSPKLDAKISESDFPSMILREGSSTEFDDYIEVHVCGPLTIRSFDHISLSRGATRAKRAIARAIVEKSKAVGVPTEMYSE